MANYFDQFDAPSALVGPPQAAGQMGPNTKYTPAQMAQLNAARDALLAAEARGEPGTYGAEGKSQGNYFDRFDAPKQANADAALGGTLQFGVPFTSRRLDTGIPLPASVEAGLVGAGKTVSDWINGVRQAMPGNNAALDASVKADQAAYAPLAKEHPVTTTIGEIAPYLLSGNSVTGAAALSGLGYGTPEERLMRAGAAGAGAVAGKGVARMFGPQSMAAVPSNGAEDFLNYAASQGNKWGIPTTTGMNGNKTAQLAESVISNMPFVNGGVNAARGAAFGGFNRAVTNTFGEDATKITPELLGEARTRIGNAIGDIAARNQISVDPKVTNLFPDLQAVARRAATELEPGQQKIVANQIQNIWNSVDPQTGAIPGTLYKALQSKLGEIGQSNGGTLSNIMHDMRASMRDAMTRSVSPEDSAAWLKANNEYFNLQQVANAGKSTPGNLSPAQLLMQVNNAQKASRFGGGNDLAELARWAKPTLTDQIPNSGTPQRALMQKILTNPITGAVELAGLGYAYDEHPLAAGGLGLLAPMLVGRALAGKPVSEVTRRLLTAGGGGLLATTTQ